MEYVLLAGIGALCCAGTARLIDMVAKPVGERLARKEWNRIVMRKLKRQQKAAWKREVMSVALNYKNEKRSLPGA